MSLSRGGSLPRLAPALDTLAAPTLLAAALSPNTIRARRLLCVAPGGQHR